MVPQNREKMTNATANPPAKRLSRQATSAPARFWYHDAILSLACIAICLTLGKGVSRVVGPFGGLLFLLITGGAGWIYGRSAWRGLMSDRER